MKNKLKNYIIVYRNDYTPDNLNGEINKFLSKYVSKKDVTYDEPNIAIIIQKGSNGAYIEELADSRFRTQREFLLKK